MNHVTRAQFIAIFKAKLLEWTDPKTGLALLKNGVLVSTGDEAYWGTIIDIIVECGLQPPNGKWDTP